MHGIIHIPYAKTILSAIVFLYFFLPSLWCSLVCVLSRCKLRGTRQHPSVQPDVCVDTQSLPSIFGEMSGHLDRFQRWKKASYSHDERERRLARKCIGNIHKACRLFYDKVWQTTRPRRVTLLCHTWRSRMIITLCPNCWIEELRRYSALRAIPHE